MSLLSMTGFGRGSAEGQGRRIEVEIKSVNHRFLDAQLKLPSIYNSFEVDVSRMISSRLNRGRVEVLVTRQCLGSETSKLSFDRELFVQLCEALRRELQVVKVDFKQAYTAAVVDLLRRREILDVGSGEGALQENEAELLRHAVTEALEQLVKMRLSEGEAMERDLLSYLDSLEALRARVIKLAPETLELFRERLQKRIQAAGVAVEIDDQKLAQEVAYFAERTDFSEELVRLESHIEQFRKLINEPNTGRKLDFLIQEMGRECNTVGSKAQNSSVSSTVVEIKAVLEKLREQVQNVE